MTRLGSGARTMLSAMLLSSIGLGVYTLALGQTLFRLTGDAEAFAMIFALQGVGAICVLPFSGPLVDAFDSKRTYVTCGLLRAVTVAAIVIVSATRLGDPLLVIGAAAVLLAVFDNVQRTAFFKFTAHHIDRHHMITFNSRISIAVQTGRLAGMALLGLVLLVGTPTEALLVDVAVSVFSATLVAVMAAPAAEATGRLSGTSLRTALPDMVADWRGLFARHRHEAVVFAMVALCAGDFFISYSLSTLVVPMVDAHYGGRSWVISLVEATFGAGMITATFFTRFTVRQRLLPFWIGVQTLLPVLLAFAGTPYLHFPAYFLAGFANLNSITWLLTALQQHGADTDKGKLASLRLLAIGAGTAGLMPLLGIAAGRSLALAYLTAAMIMVPFAACAVWAALGFRPQEAQGSEQEWKETGWCSPPRARCSPTPTWPSSPSSAICAPSRGRST
ncbi:MFS transporter [Streptomyces sp. NPDC019937]|uniref:MFS transporter n=1 Tax=Streptomyces sp. NPDC019937 TaxID=3154787 RepID=UPI0033E5C20F